MLEAAVDVEASEHPYLERKGVQGFGLKLGEYLNGITGALLVPLRTIDGQLVSLQAIFQNASPMFDGRDRDYLPGGQKQGAFHMIGGKPHGASPVIVVCEGFSTGASIHMATGHHVAVALDRGNLRAVAVALRNTYGLAQLIIAADNDAWGKSNDGLLSAQQAAQTAAAMIAVPKFEDVSGKPTDFNDLHALEGLGAVRKQIDAVLPKVAANDNQPDVHIDSPVNPYGYPHISEKSVPLNTVENLEYLFAQYGITTKYNRVRKSVEVEIPGRDYGDDNKENCALAELKSICARNRMPKTDMEDYVKLLADRNGYNPVCDWIDSKPWDGTSRTSALFETITVSDDDRKLSNALMLRWLLSAVAAIYQRRGFESHGVLVFTGEQGQGKTKWVKRLLPPEMHDLVLAGAILDPSNKDSVTTATSHWLVELGELDATFRKADIARLKSFITNPVDKVRRPYDRVDSSYQRRTVFFASVNERNYLVDDTGNRRWWTIPVVGVDYLHSIDMQQLWAEILALYEAGEQHWLTREEHDALNSLNAEHENIDPVTEMISSAFKWDEALRTQRMTASDVLIAIGFDKPTKQQATHASKVLKKLTGGDPKKSGSSRFFEMPARTRGPKPYGQPEDDMRPF
jgi:putative DNA primase/helicase